MTPKEKAEELIKKMYLVHSNSASEITMYFAKQCTLIAVDEIIKQESTYDLSISDIKYWGQVKEEIKNI
jgi:hypothetical protein